MTAVIIGNGVSRKQINLQSLDSYTTYGCNALYRDYKPDYLVAVDNVMVRELAKESVDKELTVYTTFYNQVSGNFKFFKKHPGLNSGHAAMKLAAEEHKHETVYMIGFDYVGIDGKLNNVYADTKNYRKSTDSETPYTKWLIELKQVLEQCHSTMFIRVVGNDYYLPVRSENYKEITIEEFKEIYV